MTKEIDALLVERAGYERRGLPDRVKAVDAALKALGYESKRQQEPLETASAEPAVERAVISKPRKRKA